MSRKVEAFKAVCYAPHTTCKFYVVIPGVIGSPLLVSSAPFILPGVKGTQVSIDGQTFIVPSRVENSGEWSCTIEENITLSTLANLKLLIPSPRKATHMRKPQDVVVYLADELTGITPQAVVVLKGSWVKSIKPLDLSAQSTDAVKWQVTFGYNFVSF